MAVVLISKIISYFHGEMKRKRKRTIFTIYDFAFIKRQYFAIMTVNPGKDTISELLSSGDEAQAVKFKTFAKRAGNSPHVLMVENRAYLCASAEDRPDSFTMENNFSPFSKEFEETYQYANEIKKEEQARENDWFYMMKPSGRRGKKKKTCVPPKCQTSAPTKMKC